MMLKAFTLIELLVVISIIAVLIAILLPTLGAARESMQDIGCASNQRQLTIAFTAHASDNDGYYSYTSAGSDDWFSFHYTQGYITSPEVTICPRTQNSVSLDAKGLMKKPLPNPNDPSTTVDGKTTEFYVELNDAAENAQDASGGHSYETFSWSSTGIWLGGAVVNDKQLTTFQSLEATFGPDRSYIILDSDQDPVNGPTVWNNLPDEASNNHGERGLYASFLDGHTSFLTRNDYIETAMYAGKMGAINLGRAIQLEPGIRRLARPDGGPGYLWQLQR
ncbi:MAG: prepilin-type N-terminal cleavage/methylation domain-containing protein [Planctomycetota bacterium]